MKKKICIFTLLVSSAFAYEYEEYNLNCSDIYDPLEKINRITFVVNSTLDYFISRPIAKGYRELTTEETRERISNGVDNVMLPYTMINYTLQGDLKSSIKSFWKFFINTFFGAAGIEDVSSKRGLKVVNQRFGDTLGYYGVGPGIYLVLPFYGSTNIRDGVDFIMQPRLDPLGIKMSKTVANTYIGISVINARAKILPITDKIAKESVDPYLTIRSMFHQNRDKSIRYPLNYKCKINK